jgi:hypothetical protein
LTIEKKKVQTVGLVYSPFVAGGSAGTINAADVHVFADDVTVIGIILEAFIYSNDVEYDSGKLELTADVGPVGQVTMDGHMAGVRACVEGRSVTVGVGTTEVLQDNGLQRVYFVYPEGYGIDYDRNTGIYLNCGINNSMSNDHRMQASAIIMYVER